MSFLDQLLDNWDSLGTALLVTASSGVAGIVVASSIGVFFGVLLTYGNRFVALPIRIYVDVVRGIPVLVIIFVSFYLLGYVLQAYGLELGSWGAGVIALSVFGAADVAELTRGALQSLPAGQLEAATALGLRFRQIFRYVLAPQAILRMIPPWINTATELIKATTLLSLIGVGELLLAANQIVATGGNALYLFLAIGLLFLIVNTLIQVFALQVEKKLNYKRS